MPAPTITPLPTPPSRSTDPTNFAIEADAFVAALPEFVTDANAQASYLDGVASAVDADAAAAAASAAAALVSENNAEAAAAAAAATADVALWVSGTTYAVGDNVFSPINYQTYRRTTNGAGTTDPSLDSANWALLTYYVSTPLTVPGNSTAGAELRLGEDTDNGTNYIALKAANSIASNLTLTLPAADGLAGAALVTNGSGQLTFTQIAGAPTYTATALGSIANGAPCVVNSDGTVSQISYTAPVLGTSAQFNGAATDYIRAVYDSVNDRFIIAYRDVGNSNQGTVVVASVSGTTITFGSEIIFNPANTEWIDMIYDSVSGKVVIAYRDNGNGSRGTAIVGTVSGLSISFGSEVVFENINTSYIAMTYHAQQQKVVIVWREDIGLTGYIAAATISGTTITFGTPLQFWGASEVRWTDVIYTSQLQYIHVAFSEWGSQHCKCMTATLSGTTFTFGGIVTTPNGGATVQKHMAYDATNNRIALTFYDGSTTQVVWGTPYLEIYGPNTSFTTKYGLSGSLTFVTFNQKNRSFIWGYIGNGSRTYVQEFRYSTTGAPTGEGAETAGFTAGGENWGVVHPTTNDLFVAWRNTTTSGRATIWQPPRYNLFENNYIGISDAVYTNGQSANIQINGSIDDAQTGLLPGEKYFVNYTGALNFVSNGTAYYFAAYMGLAVSTTKMIVKG